MGSFSIWHWLIVLVIILLIFGTKKLRNVGQDLGGAVKGFKEGLKEGESTGISENTAGNAVPPAKPVQPEAGRTIEGETTKH